MKTKIYLLPGLMCNEKLWSKIESDLKIDYELVYLPLPLKDTMAEMIESLEFKEEKINLLAFSLGGYLASSYAIKHPDKINKLFIVSSSLTNLNNIEIRTRENLLSKINTLVFTGLSSKKVQSLIDDKNNKELISLIQNMYKDLGQNVLISQLKSTLKRENLLDGILALDISMKIYYSKGDKLINHKWLKEFEEKNKKFIFIKTSGSSHFLPLEKEKELIKEIKNYF